MGVHMSTFSKLVAAAAISVGMMLASAPAQAATINTALTAPAGPYNLGNPVGNIPATTLGAFPSMSGFFVHNHTPNTYNFTFSVTGGAVNLSTTMSAFGPVLGPLAIQYFLYSGTPGSGTLLATSALGLSPTANVSNIGAGNYFLQLQPAGITSPKGEEWVNGQISLSVPEPATWAMMILGFGLLGVAARRRRTAGLAAA